MCIRRAAPSTGERARRFGLFKTELTKRGPWRSLDDGELATLE